MFPNMQRRQARKKKRGGLPWCYLMFAVIFYLHCFSVLLFLPCTMTISWMHMVNAWNYSSLSFIFSCQSAPKASSHLTASQLLLCISTLSIKSVYVSVCLQKEERSTAIGTFCTDSVIYFWISQTRHPHK